MRLAVIGEITKPQEVLAHQAGFSEIVIVQVATGADPFCSRLPMLHGEYGQKPYDAVAVNHPAIALRLARKGVPIVVFDGNRGLYIYEVKSKDGDFISDIPPVVTEKRLA